METPKKTITEIKEYDVSYPASQGQNSPQIIEADQIGTLNYRNAPEYHFHTDMKEAMLGDAVIDSLMTLNDGGQPARTHYNVIVTDRIDFSNIAVRAAMSFSIPRDKVIRDYTNHKIRSEYATLEGHAIKKLYTFPTVFANINQNGINTGHQRYAALGYIAEIDNTRSDEDIYIVPDIRKYIPQQNFNRYREKFGLAGNEITNELCKIHWDIKEIDLFAVLAELKILDMH